MQKDTETNLSVWAHNLSRYSQGTECSCHEDCSGIRRTIRLTGSNQPSIYAMDIDTGRRIAQLLE